MDVAESYTTDQAANKAKEWCQSNPGWERVCDIEDSDALYVSYNELSKKEKKGWEDQYPFDAEDAWAEFGTAKCKVPYGFITGKGEFYNEVISVPHGHQLMLVFKTNNR